MIGHSFGGSTCLATALQTINHGDDGDVKSSESPHHQWRISSIISLDGWLFPLKGGLGEQQTAATTTDASNADRKEKEAGSIFSYDFSKHYDAEMLKKCPPVLFIVSHDWASHADHDRNCDATKAFAHVLTTGGSFKSNIIRIMDTGHHNWNGNVY